MRNAACRLASVWRLCRGLFPLTLFGSLLSALASLVFWFAGIGRQDFVLLAASFIGMAVIALMILVITAASILIGIAWRRSETRPGLLLECGACQETGFRAPVPRWLPLIECAWSWESPAHVAVQSPAAPGNYHEMVMPGRRGAFTAIRRRVVLRDMLGLASISWTAAETRDYRFIPSGGKLDRMTLLEGLGGGDDLSDPRGTPEGDRIDMRQYAPGDSPRIILWKVYARTRKLLVRVPERAITAKSRTCAFLVAGEGDEPGAGFMRVILERGFLGEGWRFGADGNPGFTGNLDEAIDLLIRSGNADAKASSGFPEYLAHAEKDGYAACLLVLPPVLGPWVPGVVAALAGTLMRIHVYAVVDRTFPESGPPKLWHRVLYRHGYNSARTAQALAQMANSFTGSPFPFLLVDRQAGKVMGDVRALGAGRTPARGGAR